MNSNSTHKRSLTVALAAFLLTSCASQLSADPAKDPPGSTMTTVHYMNETPPDSAHAMDLYIPSDAPKPVPVILYVHGGAWYLGDKTDTPAPYLVKEGFAVASINYRLTPLNKYPAQLEDCKAAVRWLRANAGKYGLDPNRIGAFGHSAGGHLVALLGTTGGLASEEGKLGNLTQSSKVQAVCDWAGVTDLNTICQELGSNDNFACRPKTGAIAKLLGGDLEDHQDLAKRASPVNFAAANDPPFLIMHGDLDHTVPIQQSEDLNNALKKAHARVTYTVVHGMAHSFFNSTNLKTVTDFFKKELH